MLFWVRKTPQSDQNPKNFQFRQKQLKFPIDCATSHPNRPTELRDIMENRTFFYLYKKTKVVTGIQNIPLRILPENEDFAEKIAK